MNYADAREPAPFRTFKEAAEEHKERADKAEQRTQDAEHLIACALELLAFDGATDLLYAIEKRARQADELAERARDAEAKVHEAKLDVLREARRVITQYLATAEKWRYDRVCWAFAVMLGEIPEDSPEPASPADVRAALGGDHEQPNLCPSCDVKTGEWIQHERGCPVARKEDQW